MEIYIFYFDQYSYQIKTSMKHLFTKKRNSLFIFLSILILSAQAFSSSAQCTEAWEDFDTHRNVTYSNVDGVFTQNAVNPTANYINSSATCGKYERSTIQYDGIVGAATVGNGDYYRDKRKVFKMDVYSAYIGMEVKITLANNTQSQLAYPKGRHSEYTALTTKVNEWETVTFTWLINPDEALAGDLVNQVVIQFAGNTTANKTIYFDNFASEYLITWDDFDFVRNATYTSQDGTQSIVTNPSKNSVNSSTKCARYIRNAAAQNDMIVASCSNIGQADNYKNGDYIIKMAVYSPVSGLPVKLFLNKSSVTATQAYPAGRHSYYTSTTTKTNEWEIITFVYGGQPDATVTSGVDQFALQFAPNTTTGTTVYFDEVVAVLKKPAAPSAITGPATACKNQNGVVYSVTNVPGTIYTWLVPPGATIATGTGTNSITVNYGVSAASGFVAVKAGNTLSCGYWKGLDVLIGAQIPTVNAGSAVNTCVSVSAVPLNGTVGAGATGGTWSSPSDGTFLSSTNLKTSYVPSTTDKTNGGVTLTLTTSGGCGIASSTVQLTFATCTELSVSIPDTKYCAGNTFTATYTSGGTYNSNNVFIVQLSSPTGSFTGFTNIGLLTSTANSGQITCTLPLVPTPGKLYRVRIIATNPSIISADNGADITVGYVKMPDFYADKYKIQIGESTILRRSSSATANCSWILGNDSVPELPFSCLNQSVSYTTPGQRLTYLVASDENGCSALSRPQYIDVYSCTPTIPAEAYVVTGTVTNHTSNYGTVWVKPGGSYVSQSYNQIVYVSTGGSYTMTNNSSVELIYLEAFSSFDLGPSYNARVIVHDPNAGIINLNPNGGILLPCNSLMFDTENTGIPTSLQKQVNTAIDVVVYPNPTNGNFSIKTANTVVYDVTVVNGLGQTEVHSGEHISTAMKGLLVLKINTDKGTAVRRISVTE